jgi:hypothetical protein
MLHGVVQSPMIIIPFGGSIAFFFGNAFFPCTSTNKKEEVRITIDIIIIPPFCPSLMAPMEFQTLGKKKKSVKLLT